MSGSFDSSWGCIRHAGVVVMGSSSHALLGDIIPRWRDLFDVLKGALEMQNQDRDPWKSVAVFGVACALLAGAVSLTLSDNVPLIGSHPRAEGGGANFDSCRVSFRADARSSVR